jgi:hypothetical protein
MKKLFKTYYEEHPELEIPITIKEAEVMVVVFFSILRCLIKWREPFTL